MRKDVRFGLTIGAILLAVLVVYILVVPADRPEGVSLETLNPDGTIATPVDTGAAEAVEPGPLAVDTPPAEPQAAIVEPEITRTPTLDAPAEIDWAALLYRNQAAGIETRTPPTSPRGPRVAEPVSTPVADAPMPRDLPATPSTYTVQPNDSLWTISQKVFGDGRYYTDIAQANPGLNPSRLKVGQELKLPARSTLSSASPAPAAAAETAPIDSTRQYRVQPGDSLHRIAQRLYGDGVMADELYQLNRQVIGADPARLKVGMVLTLPGTPDVATAGAR